MNQNHLIRSLIFELEVEDQALLPVLQDKISQSDLADRMDEVLTEFGSAKHHEECIEIDLGNILPEDFETILREQVPLLLSEHLASVRRLKSSDNHESGKTVDRVSMLLNTLQHFLSFGVLPWNHQPTETFDPGEVFTELYKKDKDKLKRIFEDLIQSPNARKRILYTFPNADTDKILILLLGETGMVQLTKEIGLVMEMLSNLFPGYFANSIEKQTLYLLEALAKSTPDLTFGYWLTHYIQPEILKMRDPDYIKFTGNFQDYIEIIQTRLATIHENSSRQFAVFAAGLYQSLTSINHPLMDNGNHREAGTPISEGIPGSATNANINAKRKNEGVNPSPNGAEHIEATKGLMPEKELSELPASFETEPELNDLQTGFFIDNAGLVIISAYLPQLFKELGLLENGKFKTKADYSKALTAMDYIVYGKRKIYEYEFALGKVLLGMKADHAVKISRSLSKKEYIICDDLLKGVIQNWPAIKNTSDAGFRSAFLQRKGKLSMDDTGWLLHIERKSFDVLLDRLPWTFRMIRLSWMTQTLYTEW